MPPNSEAHVLDQPCRCSADHGIGGDIFIDERTSSYNRACANSDARQYCGTRTDPGTISDGNWPGVEWAGPVCWWSDFVRAGQQQDFVANCYTMPYRNWCPQIEETSEINQTMLPDDE